MTKLFKNPRFLLAGAAGVALVGYLAFGVFGVHTLFIDEEVNEANPFAAGAGASGLPSDEISEELAADLNDEMPDLDDVEAEDDMPVPDVIRVVEGSFIDRIHPTSGTAVVLSDGSPQRFLRLEEDFVSDNGPDLDVFLVAGSSADGDAGLFDDDFVNLGDLKGNIGSQNYELPEDLDLERYNTVVIWCTRFGVAFGAADLA